MLSSLAHNLEKWLNHRLKINVYELQTGAIVRHEGLFCAERVRTEAVASWQIHHEMTFDIVVIELVDGRCVTWLDGNNDLIAILRQVAASREIA